MEQQYVEAFKSDDNRILKELYNANRASFLNFTNKYKMLKDDAVDVYQEAFIIVRSCNLWKVGYCKMQFKNVSFWNRKAFGI